MSRASSLPSITLVLGGARSGKSLYAEGLVEMCAERIYLATAEAKDAEMAQRIDDHQKRRGPGWSTIEEPLELAGALKAHCKRGRPLLVDCLTLWLANIMAAGRDVDLETRRLTETLKSAAGPVVLVSNEVGQGIMPDNALARAYMDHAGRLNQAVAVAADRVVLMTAGLPHVLKEQN